MAHAIRLTIVLPTPAVDAVTAFRGDPATWLPTPLRRNGAASWQVYLWAGELGVLVDCGVGDVLTKGSTWHRGLTWRPLAGPGDGLLARAVPILDGQLTLVDRGEGLAELTITARYRPPGGAAGSLIDRLAMHRVARRAARTFADGIAERIEQLAKESVA